MKFIEFLSFVNFIHDLFWILEQLRILIETIFPHCRTHQAIFTEDRASVSGRKSRLWHRIVYPKSRQCYFSDPFHRREHGREHILSVHYSRYLCGEITNPLFVCIFCCFMITHLTTA
jgi:hypothetical protein